MAMFGAPAPAGTGLDPSWKAALTQAAVHHFQFGRDVIFTYGPLGFFFEGAAMPPVTFAISLFRIANILAFFAVVAWRLLSEEQSPSQAALVFGAGIAGITLSSLPDYVALFSFLAYVTSQRFTSARDRRRAALALGLLTAFVLLTKFTLFIDVVGCSLIIFAFSLFDQARERTVDIQALAVYVFTTLICGQLFFLAFLIPANVPVTLATILAGSFAAWHFRHHLHRIGGRLKSPQLLLGAVVIATATAFFDTPFSTYIYTSLQVAAGYSSAMVIEGPLGQTLIGAAELAALVLVSLTVKRRLSAGVSLALCYALWASFKHGFVREDGHVVIFFATAVFVAALLTDSHAGRRTMARAAFVFAIAIMILVTEIPNVHGTDFFERFGPKAALANFGSSIKALANARASAAENEAALRPDRLATSATAMIGDASTAVLPWEQSLIFANGLNWRPVPVLQSYSAYTQALDRIDRDWFAREGPKFILLSYTDIDGRYLFADQPSTYDYVICHYAFAGYTPVGSDSQLMLLAHEDRSRCQAPGQKEDVSAGRADAVRVPRIKAGEFILADIDVPYNVLGTLVKFTFRAPVVTMDVTYNDGTTATFRVEPETSRDGVLVNPVPRSSQDVAAFLKSGTGPTVDSLQFHSTNDALLSSKIHIRFVRGGFTRARS
jgi:hypothetical protein